jgi:CheY-like chemotaxis protein
MSHEIRTPLNAIIGMTALGRKSKSVSMKDEALEKIEGASSFLLDVINNILDISKIESGKLELLPVDFNFMALIDRVISVVAVRMQEKNQRFSVHIDPGIPQRLYGDDHCLAQVMINILSNATKFTPEGKEISLGAELLHLDEGKCTLRIRCRDAGIGMTPEEQANIFNIFQQAEAGIARKYGGSGLGLSITKRILELMDGEIKVESEKGKGTEFSFDVTLLLATGKETAESDKNAALDRDYTGKTVLVVDDIDINLEVATLLLESLSVTVLKARNGREAIRLFTDSRRHCDMVLMDMQMPEIDGLQATQIIRQSKARNAATVPIIAMTANVYKEDIAQCLAAGMDGHLGKPVDVGELVRILDTYLT